MHDAEGGTVAGESPDMAEQQRSSQETTTSGGGGRDPRLSALRESDASSSASVAAPADPDSTPSSASSGAVRVDERTAVLKKLAPRAPEDDTAAGPETTERETTTGPETVVGPEATTGPQSAGWDTDGSADAEPEGGRLKAAVAAWVATEEDQEGPSASEGAPDAGSGPGADSRAGNDSGPEAVTESDGAESDGAERDGADESEPDSVPVAGRDGDDEPEEESASEDGDESDAGSDPDDETGDDEGDEEPVEAKSATESWFAARKSTTEGRPDADADSDFGSDSGTAASGAEGARDRATGGDPVDQPTTTLKRKPGAVVAGTETGAAESDTDAGADTEGPGTGGDASRADGDTDGDTGTSRSTPDASGPDTGAPAPGSSTEASRPGSGTSRDDDPVDQPTTMFKAVRPPLDQPTTALKLPPSLAGDSDNERTSTFLPLRADIPAEQKAEKEAAKERESRAAATAPAPARPQPSPDQAAPGRTEDPARTPGETPAPGQAPAAGRPPVAGAAGLTEPERTRQQPLPPLPPLDLLAELTNTPPPPPTPMRTTIRRLRIWTPLVLLLLIVFAIAQMVRPLPDPALKLTADPTFTFAGGELKMPWPDEGQGAVEVEGVGSMGTWGPQKPAPIASVTKTMTAYVILRDHPIKGKQKGPEIPIDKKAADQANAEHESTAAVQEGQKYTERELLELLMIPSANNVARLLARWDAGSEAAFVAKMNAAAKDLGMTRSTYTDPSGLLDSTVSTPEDQLKLARAVMQYDVFREIVNMPNVTVDGIPGRIENNNNILLEPGVSGIKTGSSTPAGGNLLWSANTVVDGKNRRILGIVMGAKDAKVLNDKLQLAIDNSLKLIKRAQKDVTSAVVIREDQVLGYVDDGLGGRTPVVATKELKAVGWPGLKVELELTDGGRAVPHAGKAGDIVGQVSIGTGAGRVSSPVALRTDLVEPGFDKKLTRVG
ncbi:D-alanyl-D-alanine carboxypeptidase [Streptomyces sp. NPDC059247]|uniref:D-alanyl-D-alanine carboxypeptidase n=1 Tax=Streptomyces sp. NPDC059247 TaxID=3346790 RepID=UPI0036C3725D